MARQQAVLQQGKYTELHPFPERVAIPRSVCVCVAGCSRMHGVRWWWSAIGTGPLQGSSDTELQLWVFNQGSFFSLDLNPMPTEEIVQMFNELRSDLVLLYELKQAFANCEYELQMLRHRYEALAKAGSIGPLSVEGTHPDGQTGLGIEEGKGKKKKEEKKKRTVTPLVLKQKSELLSAAAGGFQNHTQSLRQRMKPETRWPKKLTKVPRSQGWEQAQ